MASIFISYGRGSVELVRELAGDLAAGEDHQVWFDQHLTGGESWWQSILEQIRRNDIFLFALSPESLRSEPCRLEYGYAESLGKPILPVMVADGIDSQLLPPALSAIQYIEFRNRSSQEAMALIRALRRLPCNPLPDPLPDPPPAPISKWSHIQEQLDAPEALDHETQTLLAGKLRDEVGRGDPSGYARPLLVLMANRSDLFVSIAQDIERTLAEHPPPSLRTDDDSHSNVATGGRSPGTWLALLGKCLGAAALGFPLGLVVAFLIQGERFLASATFWERDLWWYWVGGAALALLFFSMLGKRSVS